MFKSPEKLADVFISVVVKSGSVSGLQSVLPIPDISSGLAEESADSCAEIINYIHLFIEKRGKKISFGS